MFPTTAMTRNQVKTLTIGDPTFDSKRLLSTGKFSYRMSIKTVLRASNFGLTTFSI